MTGRLYVATKGFFGGGLYAAPPELAGDAPNTLGLVGETTGIVTDGAFFPDGEHLVLRTYTGAVVYSFPALEQVGAFDLPTQEQGRGSPRRPTAFVYLSSEGQQAPVLEVPLPAEIRSALSPTPPPAATSRPRRRPPRGAPPDGGTTAVDDLAAAARSQRVVVGGRGRDPGRGRARAAPVAAPPLGHRPPPVRRVLPDAAVDRLPQQVGMAGVPAVLLDHVADQPAQVGAPAVGDVDPQVEALAAGQGRRPRAGRERATASS